MSRHLFIIEECGNDYKITGTQIQNDSFEFYNSEYYETHDADLFNYVEDSLNGNIITFSKEVIGELGQDDLVLTPVDPLIIRKSTAVTMGKYILKSRCDYTITFDFFQFQLLNNILVDNGYVITNQNRESKYLEIINTEDVDLINYLEQYLEVRDRIEIYYRFYDDYLTYVNLINESIDFDEIKAKYNTYSKMYN